MNGAIFDSEPMDTEEIVKKSAVEIFFHGTAATDMLIFLPSAAFGEIKQEPHVSFGINEQNRHASGRQQRNDEAEILPKEPACSFAGIVTRHDRSVPDKDTTVAGNLFDPYRAELPLHFWPDGEDVSNASRMKPVFAEQQRRS